MPMTPSRTPAGQTSHAIAKYAPEALRKGIALCLSGGGFRAALFHLGALRRLNELGVLSKLDTISSVSGGSIIAAHLADRVRTWPEPGTVLRDWESTVATPFRLFAFKNLRTGPILKRLLPWNWFRTSTGVESLAARYEELITGLTLPELPDRPRFVFCATDMAFGVNWVFEKARIGDYMAGHIAPAPRWPVARAVAASSCFPPVFNPLPIKLQPDELIGGRAPLGTKRDACIAGLRLTDGGNYDNMGLEPVWKDHETLLVSDGGATFDFESDKNLIWRLSRYTAIQGNQSAALRKRWLMSSFLRAEMNGCYWGIGSPASNYGRATPPAYSKVLVENVIAEVRTDMDAFSVAECNVLENHGYIMADVAIATHAPSLVAATAALTVPHPEWMEEGRVARDLAGSNKRKLPFGRK